MGAGLYKTCPAFRDVLDELDSEFSNIAGFSMLEVAGFWGAQERTESCGKDASKASEDEKRGSPFFREVSSEEKSEEVAVNGKQGTIP